MSVPEITLEWLVEHGACYFSETGQPLNALSEWLLTKLPITFEQLGRMRRIPPEDKCWALYRLMTQAQRCLAARRSALCCVYRWSPPASVMRWLEFGREEDRQGARSAAWSAESESISADHAARCAYYAARCAEDVEDAAWPACSAADAAADSAWWAVPRPTARSTASSTYHNTARDAVGILRGEITEAVQR